MNFLSPFTSFFAMVVFLRINEVYDLKLQIEFTTCIEAKIIILKTLSLFANEFILRDGREAN